MISIEEKSSFPLFNPEELDAIFFKDIKNLVKNREDLESILFSTKILFASKEELIEFMKMLIKYGFKDMAYNYFEEITKHSKDIDLIDELSRIIRE